MLSKSVQALRTWIPVIFITAPISYIYSFDDAVNGIKNLLFPTQPQVVEETTNWQLMKPISNYIYEKEPEKSWIELLQNLEMGKLLEMLSSKIDEFIENFELKQLQEKELIVQILFAAVVVGLSINFLMRFFKL